MTQFSQVRLENPESVHTEMSALIKPSIIVPPIRYLYSLSSYFLFLFLGRIHHVDQFDDKSQKNKNTKYDNHVSDTNGKWAWSIHE